MFRALKFRLAMTVPAVLLTLSLFFFCPSMQVKLVALPAFIGAAIFHIRLYSMAKNRARAMLSVLLDKNGNLAVITPSIARISIEPRDIMSAERLVELVKFCSREIGFSYSCGESVTSMFESSEVCHRVGWIRAASAAMGSFPDRVAISISAPR